MKQTTNSSSKLVAPPVFKENSNLFLGLLGGVEVIGYDNGEEAFVMPLKLFYHMCEWFEENHTPSDGVYN